MPIKSAPYYWVECDGCGERADYGDFAAWGEPSQAIDSTEALDWTRDGDEWHCDACPPLPADEDAEAVA